MSVESEGVLGVKVEGRERRYRGASGCRGLMVWAGRGSRQEKRAGINHTQGGATCRRLTSAETPWIHGWSRVDQPLRRQ